MRPPNGYRNLCQKWVPAFAGMTVGGGMRRKTGKLFRPLTTQSNAIVRITSLPSQPSCAARTMS